MTINEKTRRTVFMVALTAALTMALLPLQVWAGDPMDGIPEGVTSISLPPECQNDCTKDVQVDPNRGDVFVITAVKDDPNAVAFEGIGDPFGLLIANEKVALHLIDEADTVNQIVYPGQYAVKVYEDTNPNVEALGMSDLGTPASKLSGDIYTQRIVEEVEKACPDIANCMSIIDGTNIGGMGEEGINAVAEFYIKNVIAHEIFHMLGRVRPKDKRYDYHTAQLGYIMDHHMYYKFSNKSKTVTWYISDKWLHENDESGELIGDIPAF
jgi:hypothetical protein